MKLKAQVVRPLYFTTGQVPLLVNTFAPSKHVAFRPTGMAGLLPAGTETTTGLTGSTGAGVAVGATTAVALSGAAGVAGAVAVVGAVAVDGVVAFAGGASTGVVGATAAFVVGAAAGALASGVGEVDFMHFQITRPESFSSCVGVFPSLHFSQAGGCEPVVEPGAFSALLLSVSSRKVIAAIENGVRAGLIISLFV